MARDRDAGSALMLVPAGVLILLVLGALVLDTGTVFLGERALQGAAATAATDAVSAVDEQAFFTSGEISIDPARAEAVVDRSLAAQQLPGVVLTAPPEVVVAGRQVCVILRGDVRRVFGRGLPGFAHDARVSATAVATAAGDTGTGVPHRLIC